jgi:hypothetical protein
MTYASNGLRWHDIRTKFHNDRFSYLGNITVIIAKTCGYNVGITDPNLRGCNVGITGGGINEVRS